MFNEVLELGKLSIATNENGVEVEGISVKEVFCDIKSVSSNEYYKSSQKGNEIKIVFIIKILDYEKEQYVIYEKEQYKVERTYKVNSEEIELHCSLIKGLI